VRKPEATTEAGRLLGAELAAYRVAAGYSQARLAELTDYSRSTIANVETGRQHAPRAFWERADGALRTGGVLASAHDDIEVSARQQRQATARAVSTARQARAWQRPPDTPPGAAVPGQDASDTASPTPDDTWPTDLAPSDSPDADTMTDGPVAPEPGARAKRPNGWRPANPGDLTRLRSMRDHLKAIDNAHGGGAALPMVTSYLRSEIPPLLNGPSAHIAGRNLIDLVALFRLDLGWMAYDAGQQRVATENLARALRLAHSTGNRQLGARILAAMSHQAIYIGQLRQGVDFAEAARAATRHIATPRTVAMLAAMQACAHAAAGEAEDCHRALDEAADALTLIRADPEPEDLDFDEGGYWGHAARAYRDLGRQREAEQCAQKSVGLCLPGHNRTRAQRYAIHAAAHLRMREADAAAAVAEHVVREAWGLHSSLVFSEIAQLAAQIAAYKTPATAGFLDQARELLDARAPVPGTTAN